MHSDVNAGVDLYPEKPSLKEQLIPLPFTAFYFINWYWVPNEWSTHIVSALAFIAFLVLYFWAYYGYKAALISSLILIAMTPFVSVVNPGANCFAIFAVACLANTQRTRVSAFWVLVCLMLFALISGWKSYPWFSYFGVSAIVTLGVYLTGIGQRTLLQTMAKERAYREEVHRLSKLTDHHRVGQDMHDLLGLSLTGIHLKSNLALRLLGNKYVESIKENLKSIEQTVQKSISDMRKAVLEYKNLSLDEKLLAQSAYLSKLGIKFDYLNKVRGLPIKLESDLFMLVREAVNNALKYAKATRVEFSLNLEQEIIWLRFCDNEKSLDKHKRYEGSGIEGMKSRVQDYGGSILY